MKLLALAVALAVTSTAGPTVAQFEAAMAAACPDHRPATRNVACTRTEEASIQFSCRYQLRGTDGRWADQTAILQQAEGEWVWIDGPTLCSSEEEPSLN